MRGGKPTEWMQERLAQLPRLQLIVAVDLGGDQEGEEKSTDRLDRRMGPTELEDMPSGLCGYKIELVLSYSGRWKTKF